MCLICPSNSRLHRKRTPFKGHFISQPRWVNVMNQPQNWDGFLLFRSLKIPSSQMLRFYWGICPVKVPRRWWFMSADVSITDTPKEMPNQSAADCARYMACNILKMTDKASLKWDKDWFFNYFSASFSLNFEFCMIQRGSLVSPTT